MDDYIISEEKTSKTIYLKVTEGSSEFIGHCKKIAPLKDYIIIRLEDIGFKKINYVKKILSRVVNYKEFIEVIKDINELNLIKVEGINKKFKYFLPERAL